MFGLLKHKRKTIEEAIEHIHNDHQHALRQLDELQALIQQEQTNLQEIRKQYIAERYEKLTQFPCSIHWKKLNAFSIERTYPRGEDTADATIIGYFKADGSIGEWVLWIDKSTHNKLVEEFNQYREQ